MRVLLLCSTFNSLSQRLFVDLTEAGHQVAVEIDAHESLTLSAVDRFAPDVLVAPYLRRAIPASVTRRLPCLIVHPGPIGDRGPAALDHAILDGAARWGVTLIEATEELDAGPVHAHRAFPMRAGTKSDLYANEVTEAASVIVREALDALAAGRARPTTPDRHVWRPRLEDQARAVSFEHDDVATVLRKIASADGMPGAVATIAGRRARVFDARLEATLAGAPRRVLAKRENAICVACADGAVWIGHAKAPDGGPVDRPFKQAATTLLAEALADVPTSAMPEPWALPRAATLQDIVYREEGGVGRLAFDFYNGGMSASQARRLLAALAYAARRPILVLVLEGGARFWSTGMDLMSIEAAASPAEASWETINALDDIAEAIIGMTGKVTVAALAGAAGAGGAFLAFACDEIWARRGVVLNPHYKNMGNLYGSELWTYTLPRRLAEGDAASPMAARLPIGVDAAARAGLVDHIGPADREDFRAFSRERAFEMAGHSGLPGRLSAKAERRAADEARKPLSVYRAEELARMREAFFGFDPSYHVARYAFIAKRPQSRTPFHLAAPGVPPLAARDA